MHREVSRGHAGKAGHHDSAFSECGRRAASIIHTLLVSVHWKCGLTA